MLFASLVTSHIFTGTIKVNHKERVSNRWSNQSYATFPLVSLIKHLDFMGNWNHKSHRRASSLDFHWIPLEFIKVHSTPTHPSTATACKSAAVLSPKWPGTQRMNQPHPPKTNESTTADFTTLPSYIGHQWEHHPNWLGKNQHLFQVTKRLKPGPRAGKLHLPEGVPAYGQPRSLFPTGPRCPVSNPKGSHLVMKKNDSENVCAWEVWSAETLNIPRNSGGSIPNIWVQWDHHALFRWETSTQMSKHQASKCPPGLVPLPSLWTGPSHNSRCQKEQLQHAGEGSEEFFVTSPEKKYTQDQRSV